MQNEYFTEKIATLPEELQKAILASGWEKTLGDIQREFKLHIDQGQVLETLTEQLMFGDIDAPDFVSGMFNEAHISTAAAGDILVAIDERILRNIRRYMEMQEEIRVKDEEYNRLFMTDEELEEEMLASAYANYYADTANILQEEEAELPDEPEEEREDYPSPQPTQTRSRAEVEAEEERQRLIQKQSFTPDFVDDKESIMRELESPEKTFVKPLFTPIVAKVPPKPVEQAPEIVIPPDHQLQNTHIEAPYHEPEPAEHPKPQPIEFKPIPKPQTGPIIKKPTKINLSTDPYREPLE